jgi:hypothetical protein
MSDEINDKFKLADLKSITPGSGFQHEFQKGQDTARQFEETLYRQKQMDKMETERRHQEVLQSYQKTAETISGTISEALAQGKPITISIAGSTIHNLQQNIHSEGNVQTNYVNSGIDVDELITKLKKIYEYLPTDEEKTEAADALVELKETLDAKEQPKKTIVNFLKSLVRRSIENPVATVKGANVLLHEGQVLLHEGQQALDTLQNLASTPGLT